MAESWDHGSCAQCRHVCLANEMVDHFIRAHRSAPARFDLCDAPTDADTHDVERASGSSATPPNTGSCYGACLICTRVYPAGAMVNHFKQAHGGDSVAFEFRRESHEDGSQLTDVATATASDSTRTVPDVTSPAGADDVDTAGESSVNKPKTAPTATDKAGGVNPQNQAPSTPIQKFASLGSPTADTNSSSTASDNPFYRPDYNPFEHSNPDPFERRRINEDGTTRPRKTELSFPNRPSKEYHLVRRQYQCSRLEALRALAVPNPVKGSAILILGADADDGYYYEKLVREDSHVIVAVASSLSGAALVHRIAERVGAGLNQVPIVYKEMNGYTFLGPFLHSDTLPFDYTDSPSSFETIISMLWDLDYNDPQPLPPTQFITAVMGRFVPRVLPGGCIVGSYPGDHPVPAFAWLTSRDNHTEQSNVVGIIKIAPPDASQHIADIVRGGVDNADGCVLHLIEEQVERVCKSEIQKLCSTGHFDYSERPLEAMVSEVAPTEFRAASSDSPPRHELRSILTWKEWVTERVYESEPFIKHIISPGLYQVSKHFSEGEVDFGFEIAFASVNFAVKRT